MASLFDAIVRQNLAVLARGLDLAADGRAGRRPDGLPPAVRDAWRHHIGAMWRERRVPLPPGVTMEDAVSAPPMAEYYGAIGAIEWGSGEPGEVGRFAGLTQLADYLHDGRRSERQRSAARALVASTTELDEFRAQ